MFLLLCSLSGPVWAGLSETVPLGEGTPAEKLSMPRTGSVEVELESLIDSLARIDFAYQTTGNTHDSPFVIVTPISEISALSAFTKADSTMKTYYSRSGTDNKQVIEALSKSSAFVTAIGNDRFVIPEAGLAAFAQGYFVGNGAVADGAAVAPIQATISNPTVIQPNCNGSSQGVPLPIPFLLTGSGLATLLAIRKRARIQCLRANQI
jgi:hypothetical protein